VGVDDTSGMNMIFGLDGGGTSSRLRVADTKNRTILELAGEGINPNAVGMETASSRVQHLFGEAFARLESQSSFSAISASHFLSGCVAVAGMDRQQEQSEFNLMLRDQLGFRCPLVLISDPLAALVGGLESREGIILIAGTGSIAYVRLADGRSFRAGGYGHLLGDEGSAFFIGFEALRRCIRSMENRDIPTTLSSDLFARLGIGNAQDAIPFVYRRFDKAYIAGAASVVAAHRDRGDALAMDIYREAVRELVGLVESVVNAAGKNLEHRDLLLWGGLFDHDPWMEETVRTELKTVLPTLEVKRPLHDAAYGACLLAIDALKP